MQPVSFSKEHVISPAPQQLSSKLGAETVILNMQSGVYYGLNPVGARVWELAQNHIAVGALHDQLIAEFDVQPDVLKNDLTTLLKQMQAEGLVQISATN